MKHKLDNLENEHGKDECYWSSGSIAWDRTCDNAWHFSEWY